MNLKTIYNKITGDIRAVSPVVATLVLIVVAIVGAAAVGAMTGVFTEDVGRQNATVAPIYSESLVIGGSTGVEPSAREIARGFMAANPTVRVTVQTGGSGAGVRAVGNDVIDIGMVSRNMTPIENSTFPQLIGRSVQIGYSRVVLVGNEATLTLAELNNITHQELHQLFRNGTRTGSLLTIGGAGTDTAPVVGVFRSDVSGTGDRFLDSIVMGVPAVTPSVTHAHVQATAASHPGNITLAVGNAGVFNAIRDTPGAIGGLEFGLVAPGVRASTNETAPSNLRVVRPLNMFTNGVPSRLEQAFLDYARSPEATAHFRAVGARSVVDPWT